MSLLDTASLLLTPNAYKEGKLYSVIPSDGSGDFTFTRATTATRVNSDGLVELVPYNLFTRSEEFNNSAWAKIATSVTANDTTAPDGTITADLIAATGTVGSWVTQTITTTANSYYSTSVYAKKNEVNFLYVVAIDGSNVVRQFFNLDSGTVGITNNSGTPDFGNLTMENVGNGWYRCSFSQLVSGTSLQFRFYPTTNDGVSNVNPLPGSIYLWGAQANEGTNALPYQKTETRLNIPRLDYSLGGCPNILLEPQRTNLLRYSQQFENGLWSKTGNTVTPNQAIAPDGTLTMDLITFDSAGTFTTQAISVTSGATYTFSVWLATQSGTQTVEIGNINLSTWQSVTVTTTPQRFEVTQVASGANRFPGIRCTAAYSILAWGAQIELGSYSTSFIPTTTASVTRNNESCVKTGISSLIGQTEGTFFVEYNSNITEDDSIFLVADDGTINNRIVLYSNTPNNLALVISTLGALQVVIANKPLAVGTNKFAVGYANNDVVLYLNGIQVGLDNSVIIPSTSALRMGTDHTGTPYASGKGINQVLVIKERLTNDQLAQLTTI